MFSARVENGRITVTNPHDKERMRLWCLENEGAALDLVPRVNESKKQRRFFEGAVVPLVAFYQEGMSHNNREDVENVREWLKVEFNSDLINVHGVIHRVAKSTKGKEALQAFMKRVEDWVHEQYAPPQEALNSAKWQEWHDTIRPFGGPEHYLDYLTDIGILKPLS